MNCCLNSCNLFCASWKVLVAYCRSLFVTANYLAVSHTSIGLTPGHLVRVISRQASRAARPWGLVNVEHSLLVEHIFFLGEGVLQGCEQIGYMYVSGETDFCSMFKQQPLLQGRQLVHLLHVCICPGADTVNVLSRRTCHHFVITSASSYECTGDWLCFFYPRLMW